MQELSLDTQIRLVVNEIYDKRRICSILFAAISLGIIALGLKWPQTYESTTTLVRDAAQVVRPLLEGTAIASTGSRQADLAKEVVYSNKNLDIVIDRAGLNLKPDGTRMDSREREILRSDLRGQINIDRSGDDVLKIIYTNKNPKIAYLVVSIASELFIEDTTQNKRSESTEAYRFIDSQVAEYKNKLDDINRRINEFKAQNVEVQVRTTEAVSARIGELKDRIRRTSLELKEAGIQMDSLKEQLAAESKKSTAEEVVDAQQQRLAEMEGRLNTLRLSYTDTYPDIVQLKEQINTLRAAIKRDESGQKSDLKKPGTVRSELHTRLKQQIADQELLIKTLEARKLDQERRLDQEIGRSSQVSEVVARLEELSRDRDVTRALYDQLLTQRERARVSLSLELENAGSLFKVQEPPVVPLVPKGLRFMHFAIASLVLGFGIPIGLIIAWLVVDSRIRHEDNLDLGGDYAVFATISTYYTPREVRQQKLATVLSVLLVSLALAAVVSVSVSRYLQII